MSEIRSHTGNPTLREQTVHLAERLDRITAAATTLRALIREGDERRRRLDHPGQRRHARSGPP